jgi:hypothetical protein
LASRCHWSSAIAIRKKSRSRQAAFHSKGDTDEAEGVEALAELGVVHERIVAGMEYDVVNQPWVCNVNPSRAGLVPDDDRRIVLESNVIILGFRPTFLVLIRAPAAERD